MQAYPETSQNRAGDVLVNEKEKKPKKRQKMPLDGNIGTCNRVCAAYCTSYLKSVDLHVLLIGDMSVIEGEYVVMAGTCLVVYVLIKYKTEFHCTLIR